MMTQQIQLVGGPLDGRFLQLNEGDMAGDYITVNGHLYGEHSHRAFTYQYITTTMNAQECYTAVIKARNDQDRAIRAKIFTGITNAVQSKLLYYSYDGKITKELWAELEEAGFKLSADSHRNELTTTISWDLS